ncbi:hypothetical protein AWW66_26690 [Micromonospora rosaria]|uniref:Peptidase C14 caspase domain-containing protein n=1 Tax=Micromonospora rosaria TaxID=47874 RepID=A0A136PKU3_9ACTN|nr:caspase family protein [Micromonospora rosaria]KXK58993.1 hypothetical protein AWW66_26690 [Micromonospora rosaria]
MALLIGTSTYHQQPAEGPEKLSDLRSVRSNISELRRVLAAPPVNLVAARNCHQLLDLVDPTEAGDAIVDRCREAEDLLLVYYAGHGLLDDKGELFLALSGTSSDQDRLPHTAISFATLRDVMRRSPATTRVLILDCCYSGRALDGAMAATGIESAIADSSRIAGAYTLTATSANARAVAPSGAEFTAFTGELLRVLRDPESVGHPPDRDLTLADVYRLLASELTSNGRPRPEQRNSNLAAGLVVRPAVEFAGGAGADQSATAPAGPAPRDTPLGQPAQLAPPSPVPSVLRRPQRPFHPLHRRLLAAQWRRLAVAVLGLASYVALIGVWQAVTGELPWSQWAFSPWLRHDVLDLAGPITGLVLAAAALRNRRHGYQRDERMQFVFAILLLGTPAMLSAIQLVRWVESPGLAMAVAVLVTASAWYGSFLTKRFASNPHESTFWWLPVTATAALFGTFHAATYPANRFIPGQFLVTVAFMGVVCLTGARLWDCLRGHVALVTRPLALELTRNGITIHTRSGRRALSWHHLDRIFIDGHVLAIAFKRDYPEAEKPREFIHSPDLDGFPIADIRHFPHGRDEVTQAIGYFAGPTFQIVAEPNPKGALPTRKDGHPAWWYDEHWEVH